MTVFLSLEQVADALGVHKRTIRRQIATGQLPAVRVGHQIRIRETDVEAMLRPIPTARP